MTRQHHLHVEDYLEARRGARSMASLALRLHRHAVDACPECAAEWDLLAEDQDAVRDRFRRLEPPPPRRSAVGGPFQLHKADLPLPESPQAAPVETVIARKQRVWTRARRDVRDLRRLAPDARADRVTRARRRFQSRAVAELLVGESRSLVRSDPAEAESLAALVPLVLAKFRRRGEPAWVTHLCCRAAAHRANALRIGGALTQAARAFSRLRAEMHDAGVLDARLVAEVASLEASLARDQNRYEDALACLHLALLLARQEEDRQLLARVLIQRAYVQRLRGHLAESLNGFEEALAALADEGERYLHLSVVVGQILTLCDLRCFAEAEKVLTRHQQLFEEDDDAHTGATLCGLRGRIALGLGQLDQAAAAFEMARESLLSLGRHHDAALACLYLAQVYRCRRNRRALRRLAAGLVAPFRSRGAERRLLEVLHALARAVEAGRLTEAVLEELETRLRQIRGSALRPAF